MVGTFGERIAAGFLHKRGHQVLVRNLRVGSGELDLLISCHGELAAVEVKTLVAVTAGDSATRLFTQAKADQVRRLARSLEPPVDRVDVVAITVRPELVEVRWMPDVA